MHTVYFRLPGHQENRIYRRLLWKIDPLVQSLTNMGVSAQFAPFDQKITEPDAVHIWICNETLPPPPKEGTHVLWFCHRMQYPPLSQLRQYQALLSTSSAHVKFLRTILSGQRLVRKLAWPMRLGDNATVPPDAEYSWTSIWSPARGTELDPAAKWLIEPRQARHVAVYGTGWDRWSDDVHVSGPAPDGADVIPILRRAPAYWYVDILRNRMSGFIDSFALYALQQGCRIYTLPRAPLPAALKGSFQTVSLDELAPNRPPLPAPIPLTPNQLDRCAGYFNRYHDPNLLAQSVLEVMEKLDRPQKKKQHKGQKLSGHVTFFQDSFEQEHFADLPDQNIEANDLRKALENGKITSIAYTPHQSGHTHTAFYDVSDENVFKICRDRLDRGACILTALANDIPVTIEDIQADLQAARAAAARLPINDLTVLLEKMDHSIRGAKPNDGLLTEVISTLETVYLFEDDQTAQTDELSHPWDKVCEETTTPSNQIRYISATLNEASGEAIPPMPGDQSMIIWNETQVPDGNGPSPVKPLGVFIHAFYEDLLPSMLDKLENLPREAHIYISTDTEEKRAKIRRFLTQSKFRTAEVRVFENRGRDIYPKFFGFQDVYGQHDIVLHLHTKRSLHSSSLKDWGNFCQSILIGSKDRMANIVQSLENNPQLQMLCPVPIAPIMPALQWLRNFRIAEKVASKLHIDIPSKNARLLFPAGSMFWAKSDALKPILDLKFTPEDFPMEGGQEDGTTAHAIERLMGAVILQSGGEIQFIEESAQ
ncbi:MAG: rhamnan synthesis F family protein [Planktomarina sp.]